MSKAQPKATAPAPQPAKVESVKKFEVLAVDSLKPYAKNAKYHSPHQVERLAKSILEFGFVSPLLVTKDNEVVAGHGRLMAAKKLGLKTVPCVRVDHLTRKQWRAYAIADNRLTELGAWDTELLGQEIKDLKLEGFDVTLTGFTEIEALRFTEDEQAIMAAPIPAASAPRPATKDQTSAASDDDGDDSSTTPADAGTPDSKGVAEARTFTVIAYCDSASQQLDALNALRAVGVRSVVK